MSDDPRPTPHPAGESDAPTGQLRARSTVPGLSIQVVGETNPGRVRPGNEDNLIHEDPGSAQARAQGTLLVVSDGMGGHAAGEVASDIAVNTIHSTYYRNRGMPVGEAVRDAIIAANSAIYESAQRNMEQAGMGCTVVALVVQGADLTIGHVGDSRAYLIRGGHATQLTLDHSWVAMQVHEGILTPEQAEHHPNRSVLMRALGRSPAVEVDIGTRKLQPGDILLVCSDGLTGMVTDAEIAEYASRIPPQQLPRQLIELANSRGAPDNVTVLIGAITGTPNAAEAVTVVPVPDPNSTTTVISTPHDARTPRMEPPGDSPTDRNLQRPPADATLPMGRPTQTPQRGPTPAPAPAPGPRPTGPRPVAAPSAPSAPLGKPVVVARTSVIQPAPASRKPGRGRVQWIAGAVAAFGLAGALVLLSVFQLTRETPASTSTASAPTTPAPVAAAPAAPAATPAAPAAQAPPAAQAAPAKPAAPPAAGNPALLPPAPAAATPLPAATSKPAIATVLTPAASPSASSGLPTRVIPGVPSLPGIFGTSVPTATPGQRTGEAPATASDAPTEAGPGGSSATTTDPSADESQPAGPARVAPGPASDGQRGSSADLCARGAQIAPSVAARAGCRSNNDNGR